MKIPFGIGRACVGLLIEREYTPRIVQTGDICANKHAYVWYYNRYNLFQIR